MVAFFVPTFFKGTVVSGSFSDSDTTLDNSDSYTFSNLIPARTETTTVVAALSYAGNQNRTVSSTTFAGTSGTLREAKLSGGGGTRTAICDATLSAGSAGNLVVNLSGFLGIGSLFFASIYVLVNGVYRASNSDSATTTASASINVNAGEFVIGVNDAFSGGNSSWTNLTEDVDTTLRSNRVSSASQVMTTSGSTAFSVTCSGASEHSLCVATYQLS